MGADKKLSVIIPIYNGEKYIENTISSVLAQTYKNIEVLCIIDGSPDNSYEIVQNIAKKDERVVPIFKTNGGVSSARNLGIDSAQGEYIAFVDQDDYTEAEMYAALIAAMENDESDFAFCRNINDVEKDGKIICMLPVEASSICKNGYFKDTKITTGMWTSVYKKEIINKYKIRFLEGRQIGEDLNFSYKYSYVAQKSSFVDKTFYHWRFGTENNNNDRNKRISVYYCFKDMYDFTKKYAGSEEDYKYYCAVLGDLFDYHIIEHSIDTLPRADRKKIAKLVKELVSLMPLSKKMKNKFNYEFFFYEYPKFKIFDKIKKELVRFKNKCKRKI